MQLLAEGELTAGVLGTEYAARRQRLAEALPAGGLAIIPAASTSYMAGLIPYPYRQVRSTLSSVRFNRLVNFSVFLNVLVCGIGEMCLCMAGLIPYRRVQSPQPLALN